MSTLDFMKANNITIEVEDSIESPVTRNPSTGLKRIQTVETEIFEPFTREINTKGTGTTEFFGVKIF